MNSKTRLGFTASVLGTLFAVVMFIGLLSGTVLANGAPPPFPDCSEPEDSNIFFTQDFLVEDCQFKANGTTPYFNLTPGYQRVLESDEEKSIETVLCKTKTINLNGRRIKTRVYEERALECDEDGDCETVEISLNWFAICKQTGDVYYFGEWSRECGEDGFFNEDDECEEGEESNDGSWEAGQSHEDYPGYPAKPGIIMPGTFLLGAKYFQEVAPPDAVDRGENAANDVDVDVPAGMWSDCVQIFDTNPSEDECGDTDPKTYCYGVGLVQDQDMELVEYGFAGCNNYLPEDEEEEDD